MPLKEYPDLEPHPKYAQLLIEGEMSSSDVFKVQGLIRDWGIEILDVWPVPGGWTLMLLKSSDIGQVAFKLTQRGFFNLKGVNPVERNYVNPEAKERTQEKEGKR